MIKTDDDSLKLVTLTFASWNRVRACLKLLDTVRQASPDA